MNLRLKWYSSLSRSNIWLFPSLCGSFDVCYRKGYGSLLCNTARWTPIWYHNNRAVLCLRSGHAALRTTLSKCRPRLLRVSTCDMINDQGPALYTPNCRLVQDDRSDGVARAMSGPRHESSIGQFRSHARARTSLPKAE